MPIKITFYSITSEIARMHALIGV